MTRYDPARGDRVPLAREELTAIAEQLRLFHGLDDIADHIDDIVGELMVRRAFRKPVARAKQRKIDGPLVRDVLDFARKNPKMHNRDIGRLFGIDGGRVSEILQGQRTPTYPQGTPQWKPPT